ncbi:MAG: VWA domain-containing protein [Bacteroidales bacterium]|nr:VWA domain-containing protein [Bacteroidales bacterium]
MTFAHPWFLLGLVLVPLMVAWYIWRYRKQEAALQHSNLSLFDGIGQSLRVRLRWLPYALRCLAVGAMVVALARPQSQLSRQEMTVEGIDVVLAMDISGSMLAEDFKPNRLEAAKKVAADFIEGRKNDRMGLVVFAGEAFTQVPLTIDHQVLLKQLGAVKSGLVRDGTALGDGLATAINRIKDSQAESKVIILLTDGVNNQGSVDPLSAAEIAALYNIRLYTIGVGARGKAPFPFRDQFGRVHYQNIDVEIDEDLMKQMASATGDGQYFRATNRKALQEIFDQIDEMETSKIDVTQYAQTRDEHQPWLWLAFIALALEALMRYVWLRR